MVLIALQSIICFSDSTVSKEIKLFTGDNVAFILVKVNRHNAYF